MLFVVYVIWVSAIAVRHLVLGGILGFGGRNECSRDDDDGGSSLGFGVSNARSEGEDRVSGTPQDLKFPTDWAVE